MRPLGGTILLALWALVLTAQVSYEDLLSAEANRLHKNERPLVPVDRPKHRHQAGLARRDRVE